MSLQEGLLPVSPITLVAWCWIPDKLNSSVANQEKKKPNQTTTQPHLSHLLYNRLHNLANLRIWSSWQHFYGAEGKWREKSKQTPQGLHRPCRSVQHLLLKFQQESSYWLIRDLGQASPLSTACMTPKATPGHLKLANLMCWEHLTVGCWPMSRLAECPWGSPATENPSWRACTSTLAGGALWPAAAVPARTGFDRPSLAALLSKLEMFLGYSQQHIPAIFLTLLNSSSLKFYPSRSLPFTF